MLSVFLDQPSVFLIILTVLQLSKIAAIFFINLHVIDITVFKSKYFESAKINSNVSI